jgi:hypothetical protein
MEAKMNDNNSLVKNGNNFVIEMPNNAPALGFDPLADSFSWYEVMPDNYWNEENVKAKRDVLGGWPVLTPGRIVIKPVIDPEDKDPDLSPRIVMEFAENVPALVFNKSRCQLATRFAGTPNPRFWADKLDKICLEWGEFNKHLQLIFSPVDNLPNGMAELNDELFG